MTAVGKLTPCTTLSSYTCIFEDWERLTRVEAAKEVRDTALGDV